VVTALKPVRERTDQPARLLSHLAVAVARARAPEDELLPTAQPLLCFPGFHLHSRLLSGRGQRGSASEAPRQPEKRGRHRRLSEQDASTQARVFVHCVAASLPVACVMPLLSCLGAARRRGWSGSDPPTSPHRCLLPHPGERSTLPYRHRASQGPRRPGLPLPSLSPAPSAD